MRKIGITGATGFIGCRLAEEACARNIPVVALIRTWARAARLARLPVHMAHGDVLDIDSLRIALQGCDVLFHCAVDYRVSGQAHRRVSVEGTANVMQVARELGISRVVHLSSVAVYSYSPAPEAVSEDAPCHYSGDVYCDGKIEAEKIALSAHQEGGLPVVVLRPTNVYGPFGYYTTHTATLIRQRHMVLVNGGKGVCNSLYVDNLVEAMFLAAKHVSAVGETFHISDAHPVTWKTFIEAHARAMGDAYSSLPEMTVQEIAAAQAWLQQHPSSLQQTLRLLRDRRVHRALYSIPLAKRSAQIGKYVAKAILPAPTRRLLRQRILHSKLDNTLNNHIQSDYLPSQGELDIYTSDIVFSIDKARRILGFTPQIDFADGMERTTAWIKWARL